MIKKNRIRIYSKFEINLILFYTTMVFLTPLVLVFTYLFDLEYVFGLEKFLLYLFSSNFAIALFGSLWVFLKKDNLRRRVKATYHQEFYYLLTIVVFGLLGIVVLLNYYLQPEYTANITILLLLIFAFVLLRLGKKFFNVDIIKKK